MNRIQNEEIAQKFTKNHDYRGIYLSFFSDLQSEIFDSFFLYFLFYQTGTFLGNRNQQPNITYMGFQIYTS